MHGSYFKRSRHSETHSSNLPIRPLGIFANSVLTSSASVKAFTSESNLTNVAIETTTLNKASGPFNLPGNKEY